MKRILGVLLPWLALPFLLLLCEALAIELWRSARLHGFGFASLFHAPFLALAAGVAARVGLAAAMRRLRRDDPAEFIDTLEHELTHALVGYLTFTPPISLSATLKSGGEVEMRGSNPLAALAPYYLPLWCHVFLLIGLVAKAGVQSTWSLVVFFLLGNFLYRLAKEFRWRQTDLHVYGFFFSCAAVCFLLLLNLALVLKARGALPLDWVAEGFRHAFKNASLILHWRPRNP